MDVSGRIAQANGRLKASWVRVTVQQTGDKLYLQATLPPKPDSEKTKPYQQRIALGIGAHVRGVSLAEKEARKVGLCWIAKSLTRCPVLPIRERIASSNGWGLGGTV
jgi:hypothetical protein